MMKNKIMIIIVFLAVTNLFTISNAMDRPPKDEGPTAIVIDDETGKPIEGAVAIAIWRGDMKNCNFIQGLHGGCFGFKKAEEVLSNKDGKIFIPDFWKTTYKKGGTGNIYDPRLTVYKYGYVCWDQKRIFGPDYTGTDRKDFDRDHRIVRLKKWPDNYSLEEQLGFIRSILSGDEYKTKEQLFLKELWPQKVRK